MEKSITDLSFEEEVLKSPIPVLVDFWAEWCGPCKMLAPIIEELAKELEGKVKITKLDIDKNPNTPSEFAIRSIPTMILFNKGKPVSTKVGIAEKESIKNWIEDSLKI